MNHASRRYWCPLGRISLQHGSTGPEVKAVATGGFNTVVLCAQESGMDAGTVYLPTRCQGRECPLWRRSVLAPRAGRCGLAVAPLSDSLLAGLVMSVCAAGMVAVFRLFL